MPGTKEIRGKIASVKSTQKITKAMEMVAASKIRRAQERMRLARPYAAKMRNVIAHLHEANPDYRHAFLVEREAKAVGILVISTDRGLCGALNANIFKSALTLMRSWQEKGAQVNFALVGSIKDLIGTVKVMLDAYREGRIDRLFLVNARFVNTMSQQAVVQQLLPTPVYCEDQGELQERWDYIYEPDAAAILDGVLMRFIESQVYQGALENVASEMAARMVSMKSASDNAGKLIESLQLVYNKARQAAITKELAEIVGGAAAV